MHCTGMGDRKGRWGGPARPDGYGPRGKHWKRRIRGAAYRAVVSTLFGGRGEIYEDCIFFTFFQTLEFLITLDYSSIF